MPTSLSRTLRAGAALPALVAAALLATVLVGGRGAEPAPTAPLGAGGLLKAAFTGGATLSLTFPTQTAAGTLSGATLPLTGFGFANSYATATTSTGTTGSRPSSAVTFKRVPDAFSWGLSRLTFSQATVNLFVTIRGPLVSGQTAPESLVFVLNKDLLTSVKLAAGDTGTEDYTLNITQVKEVYTPPNNGTAQTFCWDYSTNTFSSTC